MASKRKWVCLTAAFAVVVPSLLGASPARATFHEMMIREIYLGDNADARTEYVELQMWAPGQNFVGGHSLTFYNKFGDLLSPATVNFSSDLSNGANQQTILVATPLAETQFGVDSDQTVTDLDRLDNLGGAVCWAGVDCVSYGTFNNTSGTSLPSATGTPVAVPASGSALVRTISRGCVTALDPPDDTNDSAADFGSTTSPAPHNNAFAPSDFACPVTGTSVQPLPPPSFTAPPKKRKCKKQKRTSGSSGAPAYAAKKKKCKKKRR